MSFSSNYDEPSSSTSVVVQSQVDCLNNTAILTDNFTLFDVLQKLKEQVREIASRVTQLDQYLNVIKNPADPSTHQEIFKVKRNIINEITHLLKETKPLNYPSFQSLWSVKMLKIYEKVSSECKLLLNNIQHDNDDIHKRINRFEKLSSFITDFQQEADNIIAQNTLNQEIENMVAQEFKECRSDMYAILSQVDPSSALKETLSLLVENYDEGNEDNWVNIEDMPHISTQCQKLQKIGLILQNEQNKYLFKLNF